VDVVATETSIARSGAALISYFMGPIGGGMGGGVLVKTPGRNPHGGQGTHHTRKREGRGISRN